MFNNALHDKQLLDCLDWLEHADTVELDLPGQSANDQPSAADMRFMAMDLADRKLMQLINLAHADIMDDDNPMVSVTRTVSTRGNVTIKRRIRGNKIEALGKLLKLTGGLQDGRHLVDSCY